MAHRVPTQEHERREEEVVRMRARGMSMQEIGDVFGVANTTIRLWIERWNERNRQDTETERAIAAEQYDVIIRGLLFQLDRPDLWVITRGIVVRDKETGERIVDSKRVAELYKELRMTIAEKSKLLGLNMPLIQQVEMVTYEMTKAERIRLENMARKLEEELGEAGIPIPPLPELDPVDA